MKTVLITRPKIPAESLAIALRNEQFSSVIFPVLEIETINNRESITHILQHQAEYDDFIFISPTTVEQFFKLAAHIVIKNPRIIALGQGTKALLEKNAVTVSLYPTEANSERLLALPELHSVANRRMVIFAGIDGKTELAQTLTARGAQITMAYTHRRLLPTYHTPLSWSPTAIDISLCTSQESLHNFGQLILNLQLFELYDKPLLVITENMRTEAKQLGFKSAIILASGAGDLAVITALKSFYAEKE